MPSGIYIRKNRRKHSPKTIAKMKVAQLGDKHWNWKGGKERLPKCLKCGKVLTHLISKFCVKHSHGTGKCKEKGYATKQSRKWNTENRERRREINRKRRDIERGAIGSHTGSEWLTLKIKYGFMCLCCKKTEPEIKLTEDHIIPLSKGGSDFIENIQPLCLSCNCRKHTQIINYINEQTIRI